MWTIILKQSINQGSPISFQEADELKTSMIDKIMAHADEKQVPIHSKESVAVLADKGVDIFTGLC